VRRGFLQESASSVFLGLLRSLVWVFQPNQIREEILPVPMKLVAAKRCDGMINTLTEEFWTAGISKVPKIGRLAF